MRSKAKIEFQFYFYLSKKLFAQVKIRLRANVEFLLYFLFRKNSKKI